MKKLKKKYIKHSKYNLIIYSFYAKKLKKKNVNLLSINKIKNNKYKNTKLNFLLFL